MKPFLSRHARSGLATLCLLFLCAQSRSEEIPDRQQVLAVIEQLSSPRFQQRQAAEEGLWTMGPAIEPLLVESLESADLETRQRIKGIRRKFELGITPEIPPNIRLLITQAIDSNDDRQRRAATATLTSGGYYRPVLAILKRIEAPARQRYLSLVISAASNKQASVATDQFYADLLRLAISDPDEQQSINMIRTVLQAPQLRPRISSKPWIETLIQLAADCSTHNVRRRLIDAIYFDSSAATAAILQEGLLTSWIDLIAADPDRAIRARHISKLLSASTLLRTTSGLNLDKLYNELSPAGQNALIDVVAQIPSALQRLHQRIGDQEILKGCRQTPDPETRGNLVGRVAALNSWPQEKDQQREFLDLLNTERDASAKQQMIVGFLQGLNRKAASARMEVPGGTVEAIWKMLHGEKLESWQLRALLETYGAEPSFRSRHDAATLKRVFRLASIADQADARTFAYAPVNQAYFSEQLGKHHLSPAFLETVIQLPEFDNIYLAFGSLFGSRRFTDSFTTADERESLLNFLGQKIDGRTKPFVVTGVLRNPSLVNTLLDQLGYPAVKEALLENLTETARADALGRFMSSPPTITHLIKSGNIGELLTFDQSAKPEAQAAVLRPIVSSDAAVEAIVDSDQYDALDDAIEAVQDEKLRRELRRLLITRRAFAKRLARQKLVCSTLAKLETNEDWLRDRGYEKLISNLDLADVSGEPDLAVTFWKFASRLASDYEKRACVTALLSSPWFLPQLHEQNKIDLVTGSIGTIVGLDRLRSTIQSWVGSAGTLYFLDENRIHSLLQLCELLDAKDQSATYRYLGRSPHMQSWFAGEGQPDQLIKVIGGIKEEDRRAIFAESILSSGILRRQRDSPQLAPKLIELVNRQNKPLAARLGMILLSDYTTKDSAAKSNLAQLVVGLLDQENLEPELLQQMARSTPMSQLLSQQKVARKLVDQVLALDDPEQRFESVRSIACNYYLHSALKDQELKDWFDDYLNRDKTRPISAELLQLPTNVDRLINLGYFDTLKQAVDASIADLNSYASAGLIFYTHPSVIKRLRANGTKAHVLEEMLAKSDESYLAGQVSRICSNQQALLWLLDTCGWQRLNKHIQRMRPSDRARLLPILLSNPMLIGYLAQHQQLESFAKNREVREALSGNAAYLQLLRSPQLAAILQAKGMPEFLTEIIVGEQNEARRRAVYVILSNPSSCRPLLNQGHGDWLVETLEKLSIDDRADTRLDPVGTATSSNLVNIAIEAGRADVAERWLTKFASTDRTKLRLAQFLLLRGTLNASLEQLAQEPDANTKQERSDRKRLQLFLLRAAGRLDEAETVAEELADGGLTWSLAIERHQWQRAREIPVCKTRELPDSRFKHDINPIHRKVEQLGFQIALHQLTGRDEAADKSLSELSDWIDSNVKDLNNVRYGADALLMNGRPRESLALLEKHLPLRAFYWHWERLDFDKALQTIDWEADKADQCFDRYAHGKNAVDAKRITAVNYMLQIAKLLRQLQRKEDLNVLFDALIRHPEAKKIDQQQRSEYLTILATRLYQEGFRERSRSAIAPICAEDRVRAKYFANIYGGRSDRLGASEATVWWNEFAARNPNETTIERLTRVDGVMMATTPLDTLRPLPVKQSADGTEVGNVPITCFRYGRFDEAQKMLNEYGTLTIWDHAVAAGRIYLAKNDYKSAAESCFRAWELRHGDLTRLYLAGHCWEKAGQRDKGRQYKQMAGLLTTSAGHLHGLAIGLTEEAGLVDDAMAINRIVQRTAAPGSRAYIDALESVYEHTDDAKTALQLWREHCLYHLRPIQSYRTVAGWIRSITRYHVLQALAAIDKGDFQAAESAWQDAQQINVGYMWIAHRIVPKLRQRDQHDLADRIFQTHEAYLVSKTKQYPDSLVLQDRLTELRSSCGPGAPK